MTNFQDKQSSRKQAWSGWGSPHTRHKVAGWEFDHYLNGFVATAADKFSCDCGKEFDTPSGFHRCKCGKDWNSYIIGTGGEGREAALEKIICREVPVRHGVIVGSRLGVDTVSPPSPGSWATEGMEGAGGPAQWANIENRQGDPLPTSIQPVSGEMKSPNGAIVASSYDEDDFDEDRQREIDNEWPHHHPKIPGPKSTTDDWWRRDTRTQQWTPGVLRNRPRQA